MHKCHNTCIPTSYDYTNGFYDEFSNTKAIYYIVGIVNTANLNIGIIILLFSNVWVNLFTLYTLYPYDYVHIIQVYLWVTHIRLKTCHKHKLL